MARRLRCFLLWNLLVLGSDSVWAAMPYPDELRGLQGVRLSLYIARELSSVAPGVEARIVEDFSSTESRLGLAHVRGQYPMLQVNITGRRLCGEEAQAREFAVQVVLRLIEPVKLERNPSLDVPVATWWRELLLIDDQAGIGISIERAVSHEVTSLMTWVARFKKEKATEGGSKDGE